MGKFLRKFKDTASNSVNKVKNIEVKENLFDDSNINKKKFERKQDNDFDNFSEFEDDSDDIYNDIGENDMYGQEVAMQKAQKPESFHHFILENQYRDLEGSIRGYKDYYDPKRSEWKLIKKKQHCFTDEEAEDILRTAQSHLATDIKLAYIKPDSFVLYMKAIMKQLAFIFESIAEYRYGRYGDSEAQYKMKLANHKVFLELWTRVQANYSRAIGGQEIKYTHESVKGQESLQNTESEAEKRRGYT